METVLKYRMDSIYENTTFIPSPVALNENISQPKGNSSNKQESEREVNSAKWTKVLLIVFAVALVFAVGGLCVLGTLYSRASMQLSAQETNSKSMERQLEKLTTDYSKVQKDLSNKDFMVKELTANYSRVKDDLSNKDVMVKELTANNSRVKDDLHNKDTMVKELTANYNRVKDDLRNKDTMVKELTANNNRVKDDLHNKDSMVKELTANYNRVKDDLRNKDTMVKELTANNNRVKEQQSFREAFRPSNCDVNIIDYQGKRYFFSTDKLTWLRSRDFCNLGGANLVTITSQSEQRFLHSKINECHWIGLNDQEEEGRWVWVNKQTLRDTGVELWHKRQSAKSEPDNWKGDDSSGENCVIVKNDANYLDSWSDVSCQHRYKFICEKKI